MAKIELAFLLLFIFYSSCNGKTLLEEIRSAPTLSQVAMIIENDLVLKTTIERNDPLTLFLPNDEAMSKYDGPKDANFLKYHVVNVPYDIQNLPDEVPTILGGNPKIYISKFPTGQPSISGGEDYDYFINNAKVIGRNIKSDNKKQVLHILDEAMRPIRKVDGTFDYAYPNADDFLKAAYSYGFSDKTSLKKFQRRVAELGALDVFAMGGKNTFFIPVDHAFSSGKMDTQDMIDKPVIHGHIIPEKAIFTRTFGSPTDQFESHAFTDNLKVYITMEEVTSEDSQLYYVKSNVIAGDPSHPEGSALGRILVGNIPVANGVVHLIDRPLMIVATSIISYLQGDGVDEEGKPTMEKDGQLSRFHNLMKERFPDLSNLLVVQNDLTLFAPSNHAFQMVNNDTLKKIESNTEKLGELLRLHIVRKRLTTDEIINRSVMDMFQAETINKRRKLYFAVDDPNAPVPSVSLEGGGVNATITTPNIATRNGVIHIIDRILGIPSQTVFEKLASDPMLSRTYDFSKQNKWSTRFQDRKNKFTMFVPSNDAWKYVEREWPSTYKKIRMGEFPSQVVAILERHTIANVELKLNQLVALTNNGTKLDNIQQKDLMMTRGKVYFQARAIETFGEYYLEWNGVSAKVIRPDVECVNGVVHVIDTVLMMKRDMTVNGGPSENHASLMLVLTSSIMFFVVRTLH